MVKGTFSANGSMQTSLLCTIIVHGVILFGLGWHTLEHTQRKQQLNVTLLPEYNHIEVSKAFLESSHNNQGELVESRIDPISQPQTLAKQQQKRIAENTFMVQSNNSDQDSSAQSQNQAAENEFHHALEDIIGHAELGEALPLMARAISPATHESKDAAYLAKWQSKIELIGNQNYPLKALEDNIQGSLRLLVAINRDGSVRKIDLRRSSGHALLDEAAISIVNKTAPFEPVPQHMLGNAEYLEIINTWQFTGKGITTG